VSQRIKKKKHPNWNKEELRVFIDACITNAMHYQKADFGSFYGCVFKQCCIDYPGWKRDRTQMSNKLRALKAAFNAVQHELWKSSGKGSDDDPRVKVSFYPQLF
jgi:hypothetical protein